jgi:hypothetical protein
MPPLIAENLRDSYYQRTAARRKKSRVAKTGFFNLQRYFAGRNNKPGTEKARRIS